jgi:hypothetical protein
VVMTGLMPLLSFSGFFSFMVCSGA